jgi:nitrite reductase/ring-hydroxylating ferredoxin subunit
MWLFATSYTDVLPDTIHRVYPLGIPILVILHNNTVYAYESQCPHMGCSLGGAIKQQDTIQCPCHDWTFSIETGSLQESKEIKLKNFPVKVENNAVFIDLPKDLS